MGIGFLLNGKPVTSTARPTTRMSDVLRGDFGLTGTKVGCNAGDCGSCTILLDDEPACSCLVALGQVDGQSVTSVEGLRETAIIEKLQQNNYGPAHPSHQILPRCLGDLPKTPIYRQFRNQHNGADYE